MSGVAAQVHRLRHAFLVAVGVARAPERGAQGVQDVARRADLVAGQSPDALQESEALVTGNVAPDGLFQPSPSSTSLRARTKKTQDSVDIGWACVMADTALTSSSVASVMGQRRDAP